MTLRVGKQPGWMAEAACRDHPVEMFFANKGDNETVAAAKAVCAECSVRQECLVLALAQNERGVWGGTTYLERRLMRRSGEVRTRDVICGYCQTPVDMAGRRISTRYCSKACSSAMWRMKRSLESH